MDKREEIIALCEEFMIVNDTIKEEDELPESVKTLVEIAIESMVIGNENLTDLIESLMQENETVAHVMSNIYGILFVQMLGI